MQCGVTTKCTEMIWRTDTDLVARVRAMTRACFSISHESALTHKIHTQYHRDQSQHLYSGVTHGKRSKADTSPLSLNPTSSRWLSARLFFRASLFNGERGKALRYCRFSQTEEQERGAQGFNLSQFHFHHQCHRATTVTRPLEETDFREMKIWVDICKFQGEIKRSIWNEKWEERDCIGRNSESPDQNLEKMKTDHSISIMWEKSTRKMQRETSNQIGLGIHLKEWELWRNGGRGIIVASCWFDAEIEAEESSPNLCWSVAWEEVKEESNGYICEEGVRTKGGRIWDEWHGARNRDGKLQRVG